jgi:hypothetical protein
MQKRFVVLAGFCVSWVAGLSACSSKDSVDQEQGSAALEQDLDMQASDFDCIENWPQVRDFRITNKLGHEADSVARAQAAGSGDYPVGTVVQVVPTEAMVKRAAGFSPPSNDWEFFSLDASAAGTIINMRGVADVVGPGGNCFACHGKAERKWDFLCEHDHGCDSIPVTSDFLLMLQNTDPRCPAP